MDDQPRKKSFRFFDDRSWFSKERDTLKDIKPFLNKYCNNISLYWKDLAEQVGIPYPILDYDLTDECKNYMRSVFFIVLGELSICKNVNVNSLFLYENLYIRLRDKEIDLIQAIMTLEHGTHL